MIKDYYATLGVDKNADSDAIKKAYRSLANKWHPDKHGGDKIAEEKFKEISEAYEVLKDSQKRQNYDRFGDPNASGFGASRRYTSSDMNDGFRFHASDDINDIINNAFFGAGFGPRRPMKNSNFSSSINITLEEAFSGKTILFETQDPSGETKKVNISIPPGTKDGLTLRLEGHGSKQNTQLPPGDLLVRINVLEHSVFKVNNTDLHMKKEITMIDATLGTKFDIDTIDGGIINVVIPEGTQPGSTVRIRGKGMNRFNHSSHRGDLYVHLSVTIPSNLSENQKNILRTFYDTTKQNN